MVPALLDELVEEVFLRLPPDDPAHLVRASLVCRPWRSILADRGFRRRYGEFHRTPLLLGFFENGERNPLGRAFFVPTSAFRPAEADRPGWIVMDCRHGRALLAPNNWESRETADFDLVVLDPMTGDQRRVPLPDSLELRVGFSAAVLCGAEGCDHRGCRGPFRVAVVFTEWRVNGASACLYSSGTGTWSELTSVYHTDAFVKTMPSVLVGDTLYFSSITSHMFKYRLGSLQLSLLDLPMAVQYNRRLVTAEDGGLGFASVDRTILTLFSMETGPNGAVGWVQRRVINLKSLLSDAGLLNPAFPSRLLTAGVNGFVEGTQLIFVGTFICVYMIDLKSGRITKVLDHGAEVLPHMSSCIPAMEAAST